jgi:flagellar hook-length control protein FliK
VSRATDRGVDGLPAALPRVASNTPMDFIASSSAPAAAPLPTVSPESAAKPASAAAATVAASHRAPDVEIDFEAAALSMPKPTATALSVGSTPAPVVESEAAAHVDARSMPEGETHATASRPAERAETAQPVPRPRVVLSPRALVQAAIVEAVRSPGRGRSQPAPESDSPEAPKNSEPAAASTVPVQPAKTPMTSASTVACPVAEATMLAADAPPQLAKPIVASPAPGKQAPSSRAAADILRQREYALGTSAPPVDDLVSESGATFETLIALRKAGGALEGHASSQGEHETAPVSSGSWLPGLPTSASSSATSASAIAMPRVFDPTAWSAALAQQVAASAVAAAKETTVRVEPEGLGPIEVRVRVSSEHVDVRFAIEHPVTVNMVRAAMPDLERMLAQSGLNLGNAQIAQQNAGQREHAMPNRHASSNLRDDAEPAAVASAVESRPRARVGLLDDFV